MSNKSPILKDSIIPQQPAYLPKQVHSMQYHYSNDKLEVARRRANSSNSQDDDIISRLLEETPSTSS